MRLRNKKTGVIGEVGYISTSTGDILVSNIHDQEEWYHYKSLAELNEEWEDYEEPKEPKGPKDTNYWCIDSLGKIEFHSTVLDEIDGTPNNAMTRKIIGNYFDTREEAGQAVEKLKAWKRLEDKGFRFDVVPALGHCDDEKFDISIIATMPAKWWYNDKVVDDIHYVFGGEE